MASLQNVCGRRELETVFVLSSNVFSIYNVRIFQAHKSLPQTCAYCRILGITGWFPRQLLMAIKIVYLVSSLNKIWPLHIWLGYYQQPLSTDGVNLWYWTSLHNMYLSVWWKMQIVAFEKSLEMKLWYNTWSYLNEHFYSTCRVSFVVRYCLYSLP